MLVIRHNKNRRNSITLGQQQTAQRLRQVRNDFDDDVDDDGGGEGDNDDGDNDDYTEDEASIQHV